MTMDHAHSPPRKSPTSGFEVLDNSYLLEEKTLPCFSVKVQVLEKLSYESVSTAWLCRDLKHHDYVVLKVYFDKHCQAQNEKKVYKHLDSIKTTHPGLKGIRLLHDEFQLPSKIGPHECLIPEPLGLTVKKIRQMREGEKVSVEILKPMIDGLLTTLDFLHTEARVVHTDVQEGNTMIGVDDDTIFKNFEQEELVETSLRKIDGDHIIYATRQVEIPDNPPHFILCDFGDAQFGEETYIGKVMPDFYRAPEIVLGIP